ncbi:MAG TPA: Na+/H+ antiporter NhaA [Actinomycetota bacterium]|nr:Na+/H+ antiporter NhaA [Actinomycetota bacterium]
MTDRFERDDGPGPSDGLRPTWSRSSRPFPRNVVQPLQAFLQTESSSAILLLAATVVALAWANSPLGDGYDRFWGTELTVRLGSRVLSDDLRGWVSDGLMTVFFFVVGLEIKRELVTGELRDRRRAALPVVAAIGGMLVPAAIFLAFTAGTPAARGFGIAMPTDIVFVLAVLTLAPRVPVGLKAMLLTLAIVDDLGSIGIVAFFYADHVDPAPLVVALAIFVAFAALWRIGVRAPVVYVALGVASWVALDVAGIAPTLAGVVLAFLTPAAAFQRPRHVSDEARRVADLTLDEPVPPDADAAEWLDLARLSRETVSPLARAETLLLPWSSFVIVPLFALANAGVRFSAHAAADALTQPLGLGILVSRVVGKPLGIALAVLLALRLGLGVLPEGLRRGHLAAAGVLAGIPFTVSLFVAELALPASLVEPATIAILLAAVLAGLLGTFLLRLGGGRDEPARGAVPPQVS